MDYRQWAPYVYVSLLKNAIDYTINYSSQYMWFYFAKQYY